MFVVNLCDGKFICGRTRILQSSIMQYNTRLQDASAIYTERL